MDHNIMVGSLYNDLFSEITCEGNGYSIWINISSDHKPLALSLNTSIRCCERNYITNDITPKMDWDNFNVDKIEHYTQTTDVLLKSIKLPIDALTCTDTKCDIHTQELNELYDNIIDCLKVHQIRFCRNQRRHKINHTRLYQDGTVM